MTEPSKEEVRQTQIDEIYRSLGEFLVEFSRMVHIMEGDLIFAVGGDQHKFRAVLAEMTAYPLLQAWRSVMAQGADLSEEERTILSGLRSEINDIIELRNDWSHGTWFVGYGNETTTDWSRAALLRLKNTKSGVASPAGLESTPTAVYIGAAAKHVATVTTAIIGYGSTINGRRQGLISITNRASDRVRITKVNGRRQIETRIAPTDQWQASCMPTGLR